MAGIRIICASIILSATAATELCENGVVIKEILHEEQIIEEYPRAYHQLSVDKSTNCLFFSNMQRGRKLISYIDLQDNSFHNVNGIDEGYATAVDQSNGVVYLAGKYGVYKFDWTSKNAVYLGGIEFDIRTMFFKDILYFIDKYKDIYKFENGTATRISGHRCDYKNNLKTVYNKDIVISGYPNISLYEYFRKDYFQSLSIDLFDALYFVYEEDICLLNDYFECLAFIPELRGLAFDKDNTMIYATYNKIARLAPTNTTCIDYSYTNNIEYT